jgi:hypothetical protein
MHDINITLTVTVLMPMHDVGVLLLHKYGALEADSIVLNTCFSCYVYLNGIFEIPLMALDCWC